MYQVYVGKLVVIPGMYTAGVNYRIISYDGALLKRECRKTFNLTTTAVALPPSFARVR